MATQEQQFLARNRGKYAIQHAGKIVIPLRELARGIKKRCAFDGFDEAKAWGTWNYKGMACWRVIRL
jgi:hypothetical protein